MQRMTERLKAPAGLGFLRRFLARPGGRTDGPQPVLAEEPAHGPPSVIDLRGDIPPPQWRGAVAERLDRMESGMALVAETMKRAFAQVFRSIESVRGERPDSGAMLERVVDESLSTLMAALEDLAESIRQVPYVLAAAADDINARLEEAPTQGGAEETTLPTSAPIREPSGPSGSLPATPFELEPVDEQFVPMDHDPVALDARQIWGMEA
jgi:hypothetical protein